MSFGQAVSTCLSKYVTGDGRARRSEYWWFYLFALIAYVVAGVLDGVLAAVGAVVVRAVVARAGLVGAGLGGTVEPLRVMSESPLLL